MDTSVLSMFLNVLLLTANQACSPLDNNFSPVPEYEDKKITQSVMWTLNLDKGQCILKCLFSKYCLGVQILPSVPTCYGIRERFETTSAPTVAEEGIVMFRPLKPYQSLGSDCEVDTDCVEIPNSACQDGTCDCDDLSALHGGVCEIITTTTTTTTPEPRCGTPPQKANADVGFSSDVIGASATYSCSSSYTSDGGTLISTCVPPGQWSTATAVCAPTACQSPSACYFPTTTSYQLSIFDGADFTMEIRITPQDTNNVAVNILGSNTADLLLHIDLRPMKWVVVNSFIGYWGGEIHFDFQRSVGTPFLLEMRYISGVYTAYFDGVLLLTFPERNSSKKPNTLHMDGGATTHYVEILP